jgi:hypothetical protein
MPGGSRSPRMKEKRKKEGKKERRKRGKSNSLAIGRG